MQQPMERQRQFDGAETTEKRPTCVQHAGSYSNQSNLPAADHVSSGIVFAGTQTKLTLDVQGATVTERLACSPPTKAFRVQYPAGPLRIFACGNRAGRCRWSAGFLGDLRFPPPFHSGTAPHSPQSPSSALKTTTIHIRGQPFSLRKGDLATTLKSSMPRHKLPLFCVTNESRAQRHDGNTARVARRSDEALGVRVTVARIAPSLRDLGRGDPRENPSTSGIVRHDYHMRKSKSDPNRNRTWLAYVRSEINDDMKTDSRAADVEIINGERVLLRLGSVLGGLPLTKLQAGEE
ncbi:hypothetical protein PR048_026951 [Dryococelus australis]|uniref:Uncharacterized protein n=1 Tax=Dryococelus australis TaxID=614101 RepID=A0ABQ9GMS9_9NEOP|nr:hypothetical protein PR048_026951 [Dryococelus australis]